MGALAVATLVRADVASITIVNRTRDRAERLADADKAAAAVVTLTRPRGYFDPQRDTLRLDGQATLPGVPPVGAGVSSAKLKLPSAAERPVTAEFNGEKLAGRVRPAAQQRVTELELTY
jgi:hypothetical protein